ncbi:alternate-type signal peptide domain-containing protein [Agrococcus sp. KRD186]|uniref:alternate-type signal peptide domain-containing protein n=1 Tax=Agrococcus sp. KRD186 TaxID=2729730 RepID=UPI0019D10527|nr:alternate-type signal peptide domain-containing protein [Agrococcus sp. KRD186]
MNKFTKGSIAASAAVLLLLGGAGSLAYWNDDAALAVDPINAGQLTIDASTGAWAPEIASWVPGDQAVYSTVLAVVAEGDNIQGTIELELDSVEISPLEAAGQFELTLGAGAAATVPDGAALTFNADQSITFDGPGTYAIPVALTVEFPFNLSDENVSPNISQNASVDFDSVSFTVTQTAAMVP